MVIVRALLFTSGSLLVSAGAAGAQCMTVPFTESTRITVPSSGAEFLVSGDINGDGNPDILTKSDKYFIQIELGEGNGHFHAGDKIDVGDAQSAALADFDGDGLLDLVVGAVNSVKMFQGTAGGHFILRRITNLNGPSLNDPIRTATSVVVLDVNSDRRQDVAYPLFSAANIRIEFGAQPAFGTGPRQDLNSQGPLSSSFKPYHMVTLDYNNDGQPDLAVTSGSGNNVELLYQWTGSTQGFNSLGSIDVGPGAFSPVTGDFNGDGFADLAVRNGNGEIVLLRGGFRNRFSQLTMEKWKTITPPISPGYLAVADFDNDGDDDILATGATIQLLAGDGAGNFTISNAAQLGGWPTAASISDFDRDGHLDFAVVNKADNYVAVFLNKCVGPPADLAIAGVEVTQTIQDFTNSVPLIRGKRTFARVHVSGNVQAKGISGTLSAVDATGAALTPVLRAQNPNGTIDLKRNPNRGAVDDSFWFELPPDWITRSSLTLRAEVNTNKVLSEADYSNDAVTVPVTFTAGKSLKVRLVHYHNPAIDISKDFFDRQFAESVTLLSTELPVAGIDATASEISDNESIGTLPGNVEVAQFRSLIDVAEPNAPGTFFFGIGSFFGGVATIGEAGFRNWYGVGHSGVVVHEFGHMLSLFHVNGTGQGCGVPDGSDPAYPYPQGRIGGPGTAPHKYFGLNAVNPAPASSNAVRIVPDTTWDTMTYCPARWYSDWNISKMANYIQQNPNIAALYQRRNFVSRPTIFQFASASNGGREAPGAPPPDPYTPGDFLAVYGTVNLSTNQVTSLRVSREPAIGTNAESPPGSYRLRLLDNGNQTLAVFPFTPKKLADAESSGLIALTVPFAVGTKRIVIEGGSPSQVMRTVPVSNTAPGVTAVSVVQRTTAPKRTSITWAASDADGDALTYTVLYSNDAKTTWRVIASRVREKRFVADSSAFAGTRGSLTGYIRVIAHDGVLTGRGESPAFRVANQSPRLVLISPADGTQYDAGQAVGLQALASDLEDGSLGDNSLLWKSDRDGQLGVGRFVQARTLSPGSHVITVTATDSEGKTKAARAIIHLGNIVPTLDVSCMSGAATTMVLGGTTSGGLPWTQGAGAVISLIKKGRTFATRDAAGRAARLRVIRRNGKDYLRTVATGQQTENLLQLPPCR